MSRRKCTQKTPPNLENTDKIAKAFNARNFDDLFKVIPSNARLCRDVRMFQRGRRLGKGLGGSAFILNCPEFKSKIGQKQDVVIKDNLKQKTTCDEFKHGLKCEGEPVPIAVISSLLSQKYIKGENPHLLHCTRNSLHYFVTFTFITFLTGTHCIVQHQMWIFPFDILLT